MHPLHPLRHSTARTAAVVTGLAAAATLALAAPAGAASTTTTTTAGSAAATAKYNAALKAVGVKGVHFSSVAKQNGAELDVAGDAGKTSGVQTLVVKSSKATERMTALVVGATGYVKGNEAALANIIRVGTSAGGARYGARSRSTRSWRPNMAAASRAEGRPPVGSAPASTRARMTSTSPLNTAPASGVWPLSLARLGSAPRSSRARTVSACPW